MRVGARRNPRRARTRPPNFLDNLHVLITALYAAVGWEAVLIYLARAADVSLVAGAVERWRNRGTYGPDADLLQPVASARPLFVAAINGRPALTSDGGDFLQTALLDLSSYSAFAYTTILQDAMAANAVICETTAGFDTTDGGIALAANNGVAGDLTAGHGLPLAQARSAATFPLTSAGCVTGTGDMGLGANEAEVRHNRVNVTSARPTNGNTAGSLNALAALTVFSRTNTTLPYPGAMGAFVLGGGVGPVPTSAVDAVERLLMQGWGIA